VFNVEVETKNLNINYFLCCCRFTVIDFRRNISVENGKEIIKNKAKMCSLCKKDGASLLEWRLGCGLNEWKGEEFCSLSLRPDRLWGLSCPMDTAGSVPGSKGSDALT
jgi:hypothetical protein